MNKDSHFIKLVKQIALEQENTHKYKFAGILVYKNEVISVGSNIRKTHPFAAKFGKNSDCSQWHAETRTIYNAYRSGYDHAIFSKASLYVARFKSNSLNVKNRNRIYTQGLAKPCAGCSRCIDFFDIRRTIFTLDDEGYGVIER